MGDTGHNLTLRLTTKTQVVRLLSVAPIQKLMGEVDD